MDIFCEHLSHIFFLVDFFHPFSSSPTSLISCCFFALFARNILIVARELGHHIFFFLGPAECVGEGQYLGRRDCDSLGAPFWASSLSSRKIRRKKIMVKNAQKMLPVGHRLVKKKPGSTHNTHKVRTRGVPEAGHEAHHRYQPPHPFFFLYLSKMRGVREKKNELHKLLQTIIFFIVVNCCITALETLNKME